MIFISVFLICIAIIVLVITSKHAFHFIIKNNSRSRKRRYTSISTPSSNVMNESRVGVKPIQECSLKNENTCIGLYNCIHHKYPLYIYNDRLTKIQDFPSNREGEGYCVPIKKRKCNPYTGDSVIIKIGHFYDTICLCKYPHLVTKEKMFDDCSKDVACGVGQLQPGVTGDITFNPLLGHCLCPKGYIPQTLTEGPICRKSAYDDSVHTFCSGGDIGAFGECICPEGYIKVSPKAPHYVNSLFRKQLKNTICVKNPCMFSASNPSQFLPFSKLNHYTHNCECDRLNGSYPVSSDQSIINSHNNACQTFSSSTEFNDITYKCTFYGINDGETGRTCWFIYNLAKSKLILYHFGNQVTVEDKGNWMDSIAANYFSKHLSDRLRALRRVEDRKLVLYDLSSSKLYLEKFDDNLVYDYEVRSCESHYHKKGKYLSEYHWGQTSNLCKFKNKIYLSPFYAQETGVNAIIIQNALAILKGTDVEPDIIYARLLNIPSPTVFPLDMIKDD